MSYTPLPIHEAVLASRYEAGATLSELSKEYEIAEETLRRRLHQYGVKFRPRGQPQGKYLPNGGQTIDKSGYVLLLSPSHPFANNSGYVREHRLALEAVLGRHLKPGEVVHHLNGVKSDNRLENLQLLENQASHHKLVLVGNHFSAGHGYKGGRVFRTKEEMLESIRLLASTIDSPVRRIDLRPPFVSYKALKRVFGHWQVAVDLALDLKL